MKSSVKAANDNLKDDLIERTREIWQPRLGRDLNGDEAKQIAVNVVGFFSILAEWLPAGLPATTNDNARAAISDHAGGRDDR